ncbi:2-hydroxyacid dehydrogenase [Aquimarina hainanensis]|uniref:2-hydroxyacid dehydrogenase n=1 Tax=Aquimarina hainanensis TaxID=1578017 RepID=A0ABW5N7P7_9FLAO
MVLIFNQKDPIPWQQALQKSLPNTKVEIYSPATNPDTVSFAVCWKPQPQLLKQFPNLQIVQSAGAGVDHITRTQQLDPDKITLSRIVDPHLSNDMWEYLLSIVLSQLKNTAVYTLANQHRQWTPLPYKRLQDMTISIMGLGNIGKHVASQFAALGARVKGWSNSPKELPQVDTYAGEAALSSFLKHTDILINILPLTSKTENILRKEILSQLNKEAYLINVGRGEHLVEQDLITLVESKHLSGATLDVFRTEPLPDKHPFWTYDNIQITPHIASITNIHSCITQIVQNYQLFRSQKTLLHTVSLQKEY